MKFADAAGFALASLRKRRLRTFLTASGVMIGIGALVSMLSFGKGMQKNVTEAFKASDLFTTVIVLPGGPDGPSSDPDRPGRVPRGTKPGDAPLDDKALAAIGALAGVQAAYPDVNFAALVGFDGREEFRLVQVVPASIVSSPAVRVGWGRPYSGDDEDGVLVSQSLLRRLGAEDPGSAVGRKIRITSVAVDLGRLASLSLDSVLGGQSFPVVRQDYEFPIVGVTPVSAFGEGPSPVQNEVLIPPGTARRIKRLPVASVWDLFRMRAGGPGYSAVNVKLRSLRDLEPVKARVREMGFGTFALADQFEQVMRGFLVMDMILAAVGMIAIVVAALGIVNTMVMAILERTREIGIMKAVGAGEGDIRRVFFFESGAIGLLGGVAGCGLGWAVSRLINRVVNYYLARQGMPYIEYFDFPAWIFLGAVAFALAVSLVSGLYPARRAARVDPVVALRHD